MKPAGSQSAESFRLLVEAVQDYAIFLLDPDGFVLSWNRGAARLKGYTAQEIIGKHFSIFYPEEDVASGKPPYELEVAAREGRFEDEGWRVRKDGTRIWANAIITALYNEDGALRGFGKVTRDLTERRKTEEAKDRFIANASHELRTPLSVVIGLATHLQRPEVLTDPEFPEYVAALSRQATRMRTLVNSLLDLTLVQQNRARLNLQDVPLQDIVSHVMATLPAPEGKSVSIDVPAISVRADATRLEQVITNLLSNAYRYGGEKVSIMAEPSGDNSVRIEVSDNGSGVPANHRAHIFEPFKRGDTAAAVEGSGLGLAIVKSLVEVFGGRIELGEGDGASFVTFLPKGEDA